VDGTLTIGKVTLTVTPDAKSKTYDNTVFTNAQYTSTITGYVNSETSSVITGVPTYSGTAMAATGAGSYTITSVVGGMSATNYTFASANGTLTINKAVLTVTRCLVYGNGQQYSCIYKVNVYRCCWFQQF